MGKYTVKELHTEALKYSGRYELQKQSSSMYQAAKRLKILDLICCHMATKKQKWDVSTVVEASLGFTNREEFKHCMDRHVS